MVWRLTAGAIAGCIACIVFLALHAAIVVPVWNATGQGLLWGSIGGAVIAFALRRVQMHPLVLGIFLFGPIALTSIGNALLRRGHAPEWLEIVVALATAAVYGLAVTRSFGGAVASVMMLAAASGPLIRVTPRGVAIYAALLPVTVTFGVAMAYLLRQFTPSGGSNEENPGDLRARGGFWRRRLRTGS
jgi:hypothetical protein